MSVGDINEKTSSAVSGRDQNWDIREMDEEDEDGST